MSTDRRWSEATWRAIRLPLLCLLFASPSRGFTPLQTNDLSDLSIEELLDVTVTSVSKRETQLLRAPTAITVITQDDIRRLGITSLAEALRWVPGMQVGRVTAQKWAVSARGFQGVYADKLLVMIDGRTIYEAFFAGVSWAKHDVVLEDIDRIEVIRGPGGTLWGANAVNGVVNIITKRADQTQGTLVSLTAGNEEQPGVVVRHGGRIGSTVHYRAFVKYFDRQGLVDEEGREAPHDWNAVRTGFRADWARGETDTLTFQGDYYLLDTTELVDLLVLSPPYTRTVQLDREAQGGYFRTHWERAVSESSQISIQAFASKLRAHELTGQLASDIFDLELQHRFAAAARHDLTWGFGYRLHVDDLGAEPGGAFTYTPSSLTRHLYTAFVQDEMVLAPDRLQLTVGTKVEHNYFTGFELQPGIRLHWTPVIRQALWASISRAVRTPDRSADGGRSTVATSATSPGGPPLEVVLLGDPDIESETLIAYEIGWRVEASKRLSLELAAYYNVYDEVVRLVEGAVVFDPAPPIPHLVQPLTFENSEGGEGYGAEVVLQWDATARWRFIGDYSWMRAHFLDELLQFDSTDHQARLRSYFTWSNRWELNGAISYVDRLRVQPVPSYVRFDLGVIWQPRAGLEAGLWGTNLLDSRHAEFNDELGTFRGQVPRGFLGRLTWRF